MASDILGFRVSLVGPGRAGKAFASSWLEAGGRLTEVIARNRSAAREGIEEIGDGDPRSLSESHAECDVLVVAVPDDAIAPVARALAPKLRCRAAFHLSGTLPAAAMEALASPAVILGSLHPLRVFTGAPGETWRGASVAIEGRADAVAIAQQLVEAIGGRPRRISSEAKPLYHAAATLAAGGTVAVLSLATSAWVEAGIPEAEARPALAGLAVRAAAAASEEGFERAFTGPIVRRDAVTLKAHQDALASRQDVLEVYRLLAQETLRRTPGRGREKEILALLNSKTGNRKR